MPNRDRHVAPSDAAPSPVSSNQTPLASSIHRAEQLLKENNPSRALDLLLGNDPRPQCPPGKKRLSFTRGCRDLAEDDGHFNVLRSAGAVTAHKKRLVLGSTAAVLASPFSLARRPGPHGHVRVVSDPWDSAAAQQHGRLEPALPLVGLETPRAPGTAGSPEGSGSRRGAHVSFEGRAKQPPPVDRLQFEIRRHSSLLDIAAPRPVLCFERDSLSELLHWAHVKDTLTRAQPRTPALRPPDASSPRPGASSPRPTGSPTPRQEAATPSPPGSSAPTPPPGPAPFHLAGYRVGVIGRRGELSFSAPTSMPSTMPSSPARPSSPVGAQPTRRVATGLLASSGAVVVSPRLPPNGRPSPLHSPLRSRTLQLTQHS